MAMFQPELKFQTRDLLRFTLMIAVVAVSFLFSPQPKTGTEFCGQYIQLGSHAGFTFNCDAADYCMNADSPGRLLGDSAIRQSRPLFVIFASAVGHPLQWLTDRSDIPLFHSMGEEANRYVGFYIGYIFVNFLTLLLSLIFFESIAIYITRRPVDKWVLFACELVLVSNEITKTFFWTAHQQFFALLTPLLTIWVALRMVAQKRSLKEIGLLSFSTGIGMLLYGNFLTTFGTVVIIAFLVDKKIHLPHLVKNIFLFTLPSALWIGFCIYHHGHYYNREIAEFRQLVWMKDALDVSVTEFFHSFGDNILNYFRSFGEIMIFVAAAIVAAFYAINKRPENNGTVECIAISGTVLVIFFMILGYYEERLTYTLLPVCLCLILPAMNDVKWPQKYILIFPLIAITWHLYTMYSYGPFS